MPAGNHGNPAALRLYFGQQRRLLLRRPMPAALNDNLAIHRNDPFWTVQKDKASLSAPAPTMTIRSVQTGRLRRRASRVNNNITSGRRRGGPSIRERQNR
jgi:hypothetical protein